MLGERPNIIVLAGVDPSAGAGIFADVKTAEQLETYALGIPTILTVQTEDDLADSQWISEDYIRSCLTKLLEKYTVQAVKIGVVQSRSLPIITSMIKEYGDIPIVLDPVFQSSSGYDFHDRETFADDLTNIDLITPNFYEYRAMKLAPNAESTAILVTGGHTPGKPGIDTLLIGDKEIKIKPGTTEVIEKHGSGCVLSTAITCYLARGEDLEHACVKGKRYVEKFLSSNEGLLGYHSDETTALHI